MSRDRVVLECEALGSCRVVRVRGRESMNELPRWRLEALCETSDIDLDAVLGASATLWLSADRVSAEPRGVSLVVGAATYTGFHRTAHRYSVELSTKAAALTLRATRRIFQNKTTRQIVEAVLAGVGITGAGLAFRLTGTYAERVHTTQYDETDWAFVERLLSEEGISYWFDVDGEEPVVVFCDNVSAYEPIAGDPELAFQEESGLLETSEHLFSFELVTEVAHDAVHVRDYDIDTPDAYIEGKAGKGLFEHYEFPANVKDNRAAADRALVRLQQLRRLQLHALGGSSSVRLQPGRTFGLVGPADHDLWGDYLVVAVDHELDASTNQVDGGSPYNNRLLLVPKGEFPFRPAPYTLGSRAIEPAYAPGFAPPPPRIEGLETATTTGPAGEEIHVDELGCVKVRFHWDRAGITDDKSSRWVRTLQQNMGGSMILPRVGWEVPVGFAWGDPDKPVVLGRMYNGKTPVPYGLPGAKASTGLKSATSPGAASVNEIRLSDDAGSQGFLVNASRDLTTSVGNIMKTEVAVDAQHGVTNGFELIVDGGQTLTVGSNQKICTESHYKVEVGSVRAEAIGGLEKLSLTKSRELGIKGAYIEGVGALYGIQCNQDNTAVLGGLLHMVGGVLNQSAGLGTGESVTGWRTENVGGPRLVLTAMGVEEACMFGGATITAAGGSVDKAQINVKTEVGGADKVSAASADLKAGDIFLVMAPQIFVNASSLTADCGQTLKLDGGTLSVSGGTSHIKAKLKRKAAAETGS